MQEMNILHLDDNRNRGMKQTNDDEFQPEKKTYSEPLFRYISFNLHVKLLNFAMHGNQFV